MKHLLVALVIALAFATGLYLVVAFILKGASALEISALPLSGVPHIADLLERRQAKKSLAPGHETAIPSLQGYAISWHFMALYGAIILFAVTQIGSGLGGLIAGAALPFSETMSESAAAIILITSSIVAITGAYFLGRWIGTRSGSFGILAVVVMVALASFVSRALDYMFLSPEEFELIFGFEVSPLEIAIQYLIGVAILSAVGLIGYWRGRRRRLSKYLNYLFGILPQDTRQILVGLAFDEAQAVGAGRRTAHPEALPAAAAASA